ncbi:MAG: peptide deformylase [Ignavibacteriae bacterium]|nr:MAG: peptide deformylase [Ignavibacteriota bacterium]
MKVLPIYTYGFDVLRKKTKRITKVDDALIALAQNMLYTMHKANGIGLAAPQIGKDLAMTVIDVSEIEGYEDEKPLILINPKVIETHGSIVLEEGCLSIPHLRASVERPKQIYVEYQDLDLNKKTIELDDLFGRVSQHEIDHLNGVLFIDHLAKEQRNMLKKDLNDIKNGLVQSTYILAEVPSKKKNGRKSPLNNI